MIDGILKLKADGLWVVRHTTFNSKTFTDNDGSYTYPEKVEIDYSLHPDTFDTFSPNLSNQNYWNDKKVKFELAKKFLANETVYLAKVKHEKITLSWDDVIKEYGEFNYGVEEDVLTFYDWLKQNFKPPTKK